MWYTDERAPPTLEEVSSSLPVSVLSLWNMAVSGPERAVQTTFIYTPFSSSELCNWKIQNPPFTEQPHTLINLVKSVSKT